MAVGVIGFIGFLVVDSIVSDSVLVGSKGFLASALLIIVGLIVFLFVLDMTCPSCGRFFTLRIIERKGGLWGEVARQMKCKECGHAFWVDTSLSE